MHRLNINPTDNTGGHRFSLNDFDYVQESVFDVCQGLAYIHGEGGTAIVLSDLRLTERTLDFDLELPVLVYYNGKIYIVNVRFGEAKSTAPGAAFKFRIDTELGPNNPVTYQSGLQKNVHINEVMELVHTDLTGAEYLPFTVFTADWTQVASPVFAGITIDNPGEFLTVRYKKVGTVMNLNINLQGQKVVGVEPTIQLPYAYKFKNDERFLATGSHQGPADQNLFGITATADTNQMTIRAHTIQSLDTGTMVLSLSITFEVTI